MKKIVFFPALAMLIAAACTSCQEDNNDNGGGFQDKSIPLETALTTMKSKGMLPSHIPTNIC